ncbi:MAG TPA: hypothetical protein VHG69_12510 [Thermoleophilaceae bacterium]|nr:hypothetical protein [Thermoleophilaceae bacterium]
MTRRAAWAAVAALAAAGCGEDEETDTAARPQTEARTQTEEPRATVTAPGPAPQETIPRESPEDQPGGAGDEVPARSLAMFTARGGRITPRLVRVPPFIAIRAELRSADGRSYAVTFGDRTIRVGPEVSSASTVLDGLRPGKAYTGRVDGAVNRVLIRADAEPGP